MNKANNNRTDEKDKQLNRADKLFIENACNVNLDKSTLAAILGVHVSTIYRELKKGEVIHISTNLEQYTAYSAERSIAIREHRLAEKNMPHKRNTEVLKYIADKIIHEYKSPDVIWGEMVKENYKYTVSTKTIYNWVEQGLLPGVRNSNLWEKAKRKPKSEYRKISKIPVPPDKRIDNRPDYIGIREEFGHWEMDLVVGGKGCSKKVLLTLIERKTRKQIAIMLPNKKQKSVSRALNDLERKYGLEQFKKIFKTITMDNGTEFKHYKKIEQSIINKNTQRTTVYYAHPYASYERGSNENGNRFIRRFIEKGSDINHYTVLEIEQSIDWINNYPRKILGYKTAEECFNQELLAA